MRKDRLLALADLMEKVKPEQYNQDRYGTGTVTSRKATFKPVQVKGYDEERALILPKEGFCGTAACVLGHAALNPGFGLAIISSDEFRHIETEGGRRSYNLGGYGFDIVALDELGEIIYGDRYPEIDTIAGAIAFDIPEEHADRMFAGECGATRSFYKGHDEVEEEYEFYDVTPHDVATALRKYVETDGKSIELFIN